MSDDKDPIGGDSGFDNAGGTFNDNETTSGHTHTTTQINLPMATSAD